MDNRRKEIAALTAILRNLRKDAGLTQAGLARLLGHHRTWVSKYETGARVIDAFQLREVCKALGVAFVTVVQRIDEELDALGR
jgi:transcriptional regulator with XRE-family HTH domain